MVQSASRSPASPEELSDFYARVKLSGIHFEGVTNATLSRGEAWHFARLGRMLERADKTSRILDVKYFILLPAVRDVGTTRRPARMGRAAQLGKRAADVPAEAPRHDAGAGRRILAARSAIFRARSGTAWSKRRNRCTRSPDSPIGSAQQTRVGAAARRASRAPRVRAHRAHHGRGPARVSRRPADRAERNRQPRSAGAFSTSKD